MITVTVQLDSSGLLAVIQAAGHSGAGVRGQDIVCASASILLRTLARTLESKDGVVLTGSADMRGEFFLELHVHGSVLSHWLRGVTAFILTGLKDLEAEYPDSCTVSIKEN